MTLSQPISLTSDALLPGLAFAAIRAVVLRDAQDNGRAVLEDVEGRITVQARLGRMGFAKAEGGVAVTLAAERADQLQTMRSMLIERLEKAAPDAVAGLRWSDTEAAGAPPPNFRMVTVESVEPLGTDFLRVRIRASDFALFDESSIHFRILLPKPGADRIEWPTVAENGATRWPSGEAALHRPVYTAREIDPEAGTLTFDVFIHEGGRVTDWASAVAPGAQTGLMGPGGGGIPQTRRIAMFGDETAFPAIARILDTLPGDATGQVMLQSERGAECRYPMPEHPGIAVTWLRRDGGPDLAEMALAERARWGERFLWFAGEKSQCQRIRAAVKADGLATDQTYIAAYWTAPAD